MLAISFNIVLFTFDFKTIVERTKKKKDENIPQKEKVTVIENKLNIFH